jgi:hypothetical protein
MDITIGAYVISTQDQALRKVDWLARVNDHYERRILKGGRLVLMLFKSDNDLVPNITGMQLRHFDRFGVLRLTYLQLEY